MTKIKAVLFDMDGVLIDAKEWHYDALNRALGLFGYTINHAEHLALYDGLPTKVKLERLSLEKGLPRALHPFINEMKQQYTMELIQQRCRPRFIHEFALSRLKALSLKVACCSNSIRATIETMLGRASLLRYMDLIVSNQDIRKPKPDPEMYLTAMTKLGVKPGECIICEDNENGIRAAVASGGHLLAVRETDEVNWPNLRARIAEIEGEAE